MKIGGIQKTSLLDYPKNVSAIVWTAGCNFHCPFCYNKDLVDGNVKLISEEEIFSFLEKRKGIIDGLVISGGEPLMQKDIVDFTTRVKKLGYLIKIDTNGMYPEKLKELIDKKLVDYIAMDIKAPKQKYIQIINASGILKSNIVKNIEKSIDILKKSNIDYEFRTTVVPGLHGKKDILKIVDWIKPAKKYYLQNFKGEKTINPGFEKLRPYSGEYLLEIQKAVSPFFDVCQVR